MESASDAGYDKGVARGRIFITHVTPGGPAEQAGLQIDDLILAVNNKEVSGLADFYRKIWGTGNAGVDVPLSILRGTRIRDITVRSSDRNQFLMLKSKKVLCVGVMRLGPP
ncbi:MAG: PDZ domain-containing protein [Deltaproteobacteria bacterium]